MPAPGLGYTILLAGSRNPAVLLCLLQSSPDVVVIHIPLQPNVLTS